MLLQRQTTSIRPLTTAHLAQTMSLLELTSTELRQKIEAALSSNPALELVEDNNCPNCGRPVRRNGPCATCSHPHDATSDQPIVFLSTRSDFYTSHGSYDLDQENQEDNYTSSIEDLPQYVLRQIAPELQADERVIAAHILTAIDEDGLLTVPAIEIARFRNVPLAKVEKVIRMIQHADPLGVGSPSPQAALMIQLEVLRETRPVPELALEAVRCGLDFLTRRRYPELAHALGITKSQARQVVQFIVDNLNPYPGRSHWGEANNQRTPEINAGVYYSPDIIISRLKDTDETPLVVEIAMPIRGSLRINPLFIEALDNAPAEKTEEWKADLEQATLLVKCLQQRNHTMVRMLQLLTHLQREFILHGDEHIQPLTRASLAKKLDLHESTISRAVSDKAIQLPNGRIYPLARFFDRSLHIRTTLKQFIDQESTPLSDTDLVELLASQGYTVARRTVAKYRSMEGILPAHLRIQQTQNNIRSESYSLA
jgi:RNA polymerase sigma-54 factor